MEANLIALEKLESSKSNPTDLHSFQSAQKLGYAFFQAKDYKFSSTSCKLILKWIRAIDLLDIENISSDSNVKTIGRLDKCKIQLWALWTLVQSSVYLKEGDNYILELLQDLVSLLKTSKKILDSTTRESTWKKMKMFIWAQKSSYLSSKLLLLRINKDSDFSLDEECNKMLINSLPNLVRDLRVKKLYAKELHESLKEYEERLGFNYGLWLFENAEDEIKLEGCSVLEKFASTQKESLFAARCCFQQSNMELSLSACKKGLITCPESEQGEDLLNLHVKLSSDMVDSKLMCQEANEQARERYKLKEFELFYKMKKIEVYIEKLQKDEESEPLLLAKALRMMQRHLEALDLLSKIKKKNKTLEMVFLEIILKFETNMKVTIKELQSFSKGILKENKKEFFEEYHAWFWLMGFYETAIEISYGLDKTSQNLPCKWFLKSGSSTSEFVSSTGGDADEAIRVLSNSLSSTKSRIHISTEFQSLHQVFETLLTLGDLYQERGLPKMAKYYFQKAKELAETRCCIGISSRIHEKLELLLALTQVSEELEANDKDIRYGKLMGLLQSDDKIHQHFEEIYLAEIKILNGKSSKAVKKTFDCLLDYFEPNQLWYEQALVSYYHGDFNETLKILSNHQELYLTDTLKPKAILRASNCNELDLRTAAELCTSDLCILRDLYAELFHSQKKRVSINNAEDAFLVSSCVGLTLRAERAKLLEENEDHSLYQWHLMKKIEDAAVVQRAQVSARLNSEWTVLTVVLHKNQFLLCRTEKENDFVVKMDENCSLIIGLMEEFASIMKINHASTGNSTVEVAKSITKSDKNKWWEERYSLETDLSNWLDKFENAFLGWTAVFFRGFPSSKRLSKEFESIITSRFNPKEHEAARLCLRSGLDTAVIAEALVNLCPLSVDRDLSKAISMIPSSVLEDFKDVKRHPVMLCLSGQLQQVPWESLPLFQGHAVSRLPSLPFALETFAKRAEGDKWSFLIDPKDELLRTQETLRPFFSENSDQWEGIIGCPKSTEDDSKTMIHDSFQRFLSEKSLFLYCGHGSGEEHFDRNEITKIKDCAPTILMGCSSGSRKNNGIFEPNGVIDSYALARCPLVVGNLWNVTDKDIDRFTLSVLEGLNNGEKDLLHLVATSRKACKLTKLVGAAPVCFGIPWKL